MIQNFSIPIWLTGMKPKKFHNHAGLKWLIDNRRRKMFLDYGFTVLRRASGMATARGIWKDATFDQKVEFIQAYNKAVCEEARQESEGF